MNAIELADKLEDATTDPFQVVPWFKALNQQAATTLRQQQKEIEKLKAEVVSYRTDAEKLTMRLIDIAVSVPVKKLTDEEIHQLWDACRTGIVYDQVQAFAKAILRKASEK